VVLIALDRVSLTAESARELFGHAWDAFRPLRQMVGRFRLSSEQQRIAHAAVATVKAHPAMTVVDAALDLSLAAKSATGTILIFALRGVAFDEVFEEDLFAHEEAGFLGLSSAVCRALIFDAQTGDAIAPVHAMGSLDSDQFLRNLDTIRR
jgi:hypothetical protein